MSKSFNGSTSRIHFENVPEAMNDAMAIFMVLKVEETSESAWQSFLQFDADLTDGATTRLAYGRRSTGLMYFSNSGGIGDGLAFGDADGWSKAWMIRSAAAATEFGKAADGVTTPTTAAGEAVADGLTVAGFDLKVGGDDDPFTGKIAVLAWWDGSPPTSAQLAALESTADLLALSPDHAYDTESGFVDLVGSFDPTAEIDITDSADDTTNWTFAGGGGGTAYTAPVEGTGLTEVRGSATADYVATLAYTAPAASAEPIEVCGNAAVVFTTTGTAYTGPADNAILEMRGSASAVYSGGPIAYTAGGGGELDLRGRVRDIAFSGTTSGPMRNTFICRPTGNGTFVCRRA